MTLLHKEKTMTLTLKSTKETDTMTNTFKTSRRYSIENNTPSALKVKVKDKITKPVLFKKTKVKAIIKYNVIDKQNVVYFKHNRCFYKMLDSKTVRLLSASFKYDGNFSHGLVAQWSDKIEYIKVYEDEEVLFDGKPMALEMDTFTLSEKE